MIAIEGAGAGRPRRRSRLWDGVLAHGGDRRRRYRASASPGRPRRHRLHHLHLGHRRRAQRRDADPRQHPRPIAAAPIGCWRCSVSATRCSCSFLPLSHSYEHTVGLMFPISIGAQIYFAEKRRDAGAQHGRGAADHHDRGAAALRDHAPAHHAPDRARARAEAASVRRAVALGRKRGSPARR